MAKKNIGSSCAQFIFLGILIFAIVVVYLMVTPDFSSARKQAREKACYANMRVMLGAVEMYNMDNPDKMMAFLDEPEIDELVREKYLRSKPRKFEPDCEYYSFGNLASDSGFICCKVHGTVEDSSETKLPGPPPGPPPTPPTIWDSILDFIKRL